MPNNNSFAETLAQLTENTSNIMSIMEGINESMAGTEEEVKVSDEIVLPSFANIVKRVNRVENTVSKFTQGKGVVETDDGTYRKIKVSTISRPPEMITGVADVSTFNINANWFFEELQYPRCVVKLDLTGKINDDSDRVYVNRVIIDANAQTSNGDTGLEFYNNNINGLNIGYSSLIALLENNNLSYKEDKDEVKLPLTYEKYKGEFAITEIKLLKNDKGKSQQWYYLDNVNYSVVNGDGVEISAGHILKAGQYLRFNDSLYKIAEIIPSQKRLKLEYAVGYETLGTGDIVELYNAPFSEKIVEIGIGVNEIDIIYVKGVNEEYNLVSNNWSEPISFYTNDLTFEGKSHINFLSYYNENVADFGQTWIAQAKEKQIFSLDGIKPNAPTLDVTNFNVVQINTQLDATLDKETYNKLTSEIASTKSNITATRNTIATNKDLLIRSSSPDDRANMQNIINSDTETLNSLTTQYNSLVDELNTLLNESGAINYSPKYHIRGFFGIPESKYTDEEKQLGEQVIIGFEIMYRYLHTDESGIKLDTYEYTDVNNTIQTGIFTDWNIVQSSILAKKLNNSTGVYEWTSENPADGSQININQIDIPIQAGEKVEIKIRSISEAGYPYNPLKSDWSNSVIVSFPDNLTSDNTVTTMLDTVKNDMTAVVLQETLSAAGVYTHTADGNSSYKHKSSNISYTDSSTSADNVTTLVEMSVQDKLDALTKSLAVWTVTMQKTMQQQFDSSYNAMKEQISELTNKLSSFGDTTSLSDAISTNKESLKQTNDNLADVHNDLDKLKRMIGITVKEGSGDTINYKAYQEDIQPKILTGANNLCEYLDTLSSYITQIANAFNLQIGVNTTKSGN
jgi:hypothetical protein